MPRPRRLSRRRKGPPCKEQPPRALGRRGPPCAGASGTQGAEGEPAPKSGAGAPAKEVAGAGVAPGALRKLSSGGGDEIGVSGCPTAVKRLENRLFSALAVSRRPGEASGTL